MTAPTRPKVGRILWSGFLGALIGGLGVFLLGVAVLAAIGPKPRFPGDPNDGAGYSLLGLAMVTGFLGGMFGLVRGIRSHREDRSQAGR